MPLKDILLHVDNSPACEERILTAIKLAQLHQAHLTAFYVISKPQIPGFIEAQLGSEVLKIQDKSAREDAETTKALFEKLSADSGLTTEWLQAEGDLVDELLLQSRYGDLCILGQREPESIEAPGASEMPDTILLRSGRPVLVVPGEGAFETIGEHILVAWDGSRLATRAVNDAMPLMQGAKQVDVLVINPEEAHGLHEHGPIAGADMVQHLKRHGINAQAKHMEAGNHSPGDALLTYAGDNGIDLIVMGGYGHKRWREVVLGGVTRHILTHMIIPAFMTH